MHHILFMMQKNLGNNAILFEIIQKLMRVKLEPETAFIGKKFTYIFLVVIFGLNLITFIWFFLFSKFSY